MNLFTHNNTNNSPDNNTSATVQKPLSQRPRRRFARNAISLAISLGSLAVPCVLAGTDKSNTDDESALASSQMLEEVMVTGTKRKASMQVVPIAISAFTQSDIQRMGVTSARDLAGKIPNLQLGTGTDSGTATTIRGVTSTDFTEVAEGAVSYHVDGAYSPRPQGALALMYDLERVEVLRGPQGTLFGMNSPGGSINIIPHKPVFDETSGSLESELGSYNQRQLRGMVNLGLSDNFALRGTFMMNTRDGIIDQQMDTTDIASPHNGIALDGIPDVDQRRNHKVDKSDYYNNVDQWGARLIANWRPSDKLDMFLTYEHFGDKGAGDMMFVDCEQAKGTVNECNHTLRWANINVPGEKDMDVDDYRFNVTYALNDDMALDYRVSYQDMQRYQIEDIDGGAHAASEWSDIGAPSTPESAITNYYPIWDDMSETMESRYQTTSHELQIKSTGSGRFKYVAGVFYLEEDKRILYNMEMLTNKSYEEKPELPLGFIPDGLPDSWLFDQNKRTTKSAAVFAQFDYLLTDELNLTLGMRHTQDKKADAGGVTYAYWGGNADWYNGQHTPTGVRGHQSNDLTWNMGTTSDGGPVMPASDPVFVEKEWNKDTYRIGAQYFINGDEMLFGSIATGYKMGGMYEMADHCNNGCVRLLEYQPENVTTYELGYKSTLLDGSLRFNATAFFSNYEDMQNTGDKVIGVDENPNSPKFGDPVIAWTTDNLSQSEISGLELELDYIPWANGRLTGFIAYLHTEITDDGSFEDGYACEERMIYGQAECGSSGYASIVGNQLPFAPEYSLSVSYEHNIELGHGYQLTPHVAARWQDDTWLDVQNYGGEHLSQQQDAYTKLDASLRLDAPDDSYYLELAVSNLTNENTKNFFGFGHGMVRGSYDLPRLYSLRVGAQF
jgi:iron complex outermembrane recepter protein